MLRIIHLLFTVVVNDVFRLPMIFLNQIATRYDHKRIEANRFGVII
jgi:hypothetical protein